MWWARLSKGAWYSQDAAPVAYSTGRELITRALTSHKGFHHPMWAALTF